MIYLFLLMLVVMPYERNPYLYLSSSFMGLFPDFTFIKLLGLLGIAGVVVTRGSSPPLKLLRSDQAKAFAAFLFLACIAGLLNGTVMRPLTRLLSIVLLLPFVLATVRTPKRLDLTLAVMCASWFLVFPYALRQMFRYGGRLGVGLSEPNYFAIAMLLVLPLAFVFAKHAASRRKRAFWVAGASLLFIAVVLTGSRGAFIGLMAALLQMTWSLSRNRVRSFALAGTGLFLALLVIPNPLLDRLMASGLDPAARDAGIEASNRERLQVLQGGLRMMAERPLSGVGLGNFKSHMANYPDLGATKIAHNTYLQIGAELGLPSLIAFLFVLVAAVRSLRRSRRLARRLNDRRAYDVAIAMRVGVIAFMISAVFLSAQFERSFWLLIFATICLERVMVMRTAENAELEDAKSARMRGVDAWEPRTA